MSWLPYLNTDNSNLQPDDQNVVATLLVWTFQDVQGFPWGTPEVVLFELVVGDDDCAFVPLSENLLQGKADSGQGFLATDCRTLRLKQYLEVAENIINMATLWLEVGIQIRKNWVEFPGGPG